MCTRLLDPTPRPFFSPHDHISSSPAGTESKFQTWRAPEQKKTLRRFPVHLGIPPSPNSPWTVKKKKVKAGCRGGGEEGKGGKGEGGDSTRVAPNRVSLSPHPSGSHRVVCFFSRLSELVRAGLGRGGGVFLGGGGRGLPGEWVEGVYISIRCLIG